MASATLGSTYVLSERGAEQLAALDSTRAPAHSAGFTSRLPESREASLKALSALERRLEAGATKAR